MVRFCRLPLFGDISGVNDTWLETYLESMIYGEALNDYWLDFVDCPYL